MALLIVFASFVLALLVYPNMPPLMASHWGFAGEVNGYLPRFWGTFLMPLLSVGLYLLFLVLPRIDPYTQNIKFMRLYYNRIILSILIFLFYLYSITLVWNLGYRFNLMQVLSPAFGVLFFIIGDSLTHAKQNWFLGIRTPWTLSSESVWDKTNILGGRLFKIVGLFSLAGVILPQFWWLFFFIPIISVTLFIFLYSYWLYIHL